MPGQSKITSFFAATPQKQLPGLGILKSSTTTDPGSDNHGPARKRPKTEGCDEVQPLNDNPAFEQNRVVQNQSIFGSNLSMKLKEQCRRTPILTENFGVTWFEALESEFKKPYFVQLCDFVINERKNAVIYPSPENVFAWTQFFPIRKTKVVILGQDPYHGARQAHGLCFSVPNGVDIPPSLRNIYKELETDIPGFVNPDHGNLTGWVNQGVLLLNAVLTVRAGNPNSHKDHGWEFFTDAVIQWLNQNLRGVVFLLWGKYAQVKGSKINTKNHYVLQSAHPSPLSATRFFGCKHFSRTNEILTKCGKTPINWGNL